MGCGAQKRCWVFAIASGSKRSLKTTGNPPGKTGVGRSLKSAEGSLGLGSEVHTVIHTRTVGRRRENLGNQLSIGCVRRCLFEDRAYYDERACPITNAAQALAGGSTGVASSHSGFKSAGFETETGTVRTASGLTETAGDAGCILAEGVQQP